MDMKDEAESSLSRLSMEDEDYDEPWPSIEMLCDPPDWMKQNFPKFWSSIQKYYLSSAPQKTIPKLSPMIGVPQGQGAELCSYESCPFCSFCFCFFSGVKRYLDCSGFILDWNDSNKTATVLTSAKVMRFPGPRDDFYIAIRLANGKILLAEEDYVDYYNNIVTLKVNSDVTLKPVERSLETGGVVVALGREFYTCKLLESSGLIRNDHPYFGCELMVSSTCSGSEVLEGGPLITRTGHVCGINFFDGYTLVHPLTTSVIDSCLNKWNSCGIVMRPWFGLSVIDIAQLPHDAMERIAGVHGDSTAVVKEVYEGSPANNVGVHPGETVTALQRSRKKMTIDSASEYARTLSNISGELSACCANKTPTPEILITVRGYDSDSCKVVHAQNLGVNDKKFCCSWLVDESDEPDWALEPRFGSQNKFPHEIDDVNENGINNVSLGPTGQAPDMILE